MTRCTEQLSSLQVKEDATLSLSAVAAAKTTINLRNPFSQLFEPTIKATTITSKSFLDTDDTDNTEIVSFLSNTSNDELDGLDLLGDAKAPITANGEVEYLRSSSTHSLKRPSVSFDSHDGTNLVTGSGINYDSKEPSDGGSYSSKKRRGSGEFSSFSEFCLDNNMYSADFQMSHRAPSTVCPPQMESAARLRCSISTIYLL